MKKQLLTLAFIPVLAACNISGKVKDVLALSEELQQKYHCENANITLNNGSEIKITLQNSPYNDSSEAVKQRISDEIGHLVMEHEIGKGLKEGYTLFSEKNDNNIVVTTSSSSFPMHLGK